jgi:Tol biopolymer transport system component
MSEYGTLLERELEELPPRRIPFERLERRRDRRRRNRRIGNAVLAIALAVAAIGGTLSAIRNAKIPAPGVFPTGPEDWSRTWIERPGTGDSVNLVTAGGPGLVAMGSDVDGAPLAWASPDGASWERVPDRGLGTGDIFDVAAGPGGLVAVGTPCEGCPFDGILWTSEDGRTWDRTADDPALGDALVEGIAAAGPGFVAVGGWNGAWFSADGVGWTRASVPPVPSDVYPGDDGKHPQVYLTDVTGGGGRLVAVGWASLEGDGDQTRAVLWTSVDGMGWTDVPVDGDVFPAGTTLTSVAGRPGGFVAIGTISGAGGGYASAAWHSADGLVWNRVGRAAFVSAYPDGTTGDGTRVSLNVSSVAAGPGGFVAVGADGYCHRSGDGCPSSEAVVWTSRGGVEWSRVDSDPVFRVDDPRDPSKQEGAAALRVVTWGGRFAFVGDYDGGQAVWLSGAPDAQVDRSPEPDTPPRPDLGPGGDVIVLEPLGIGQGPDLAAQDPGTGEIRKIVETAGILDCRDRCRSFVASADWSSDHQWVAFDVTFSLEGVGLGPCGPAAGVWVKHDLGAPHQLTEPCDAPPPDADPFIEELWAWSPLDARLAYARVDGATDQLFVIDPSDGRRTSLGTANDDLTALAWSPDGTRIAYADGSSLYAVEVDGGDRSPLGDAFADVVDIEWSPDGRQIMVLDRGRYRLQVMNADGSAAHSLVEGEDACCEMEWSPNGQRVLYMISIGTGNPPASHWDSEVWTVSPDGSNRIEVFDSDGCDMGDSGDANPVWAPNGSQVAYNACNRWVESNADGSGEPEPIDELTYRSWRGGPFVHPMERIAAG